MYGHIRLKEQKLSSLLISGQVSLNLYSVATLQPQYTILLKSVL